MVAGKNLLKVPIPEIKHSNKICFILPVPTAGRESPAPDNKIFPPPPRITACMTGANALPSLLSGRIPVTKRGNAMSCRHALPALLGLILLASGCAGGFSRHYQAADDHVRPVDTLESCSAPRVEQLPASVMEKRLAAALADGYVRLGRATWESAVPASADDAAAQAGRVGACLVLQSVTPIPQQPEKPHYQAHPGFVSRIGQRGIFAEDNSGNLGGPSTQPAVRYCNDAVFLARTR